MRFVVSTHQYLPESISTILIKENLGRPDGVIKLFTGFIELIAASNIGFSVLPKGISDISILNWSVIGKLSNTGSAGLFIFCPNWPGLPVLQPQ